MMEIRATEDKLDRIVVQLNSLLDPGQAPSSVKAEVGMTLAGMTLGECFDEYLNRGFNPDRLPTAARHIGETLFALGSWKLLRAVQDRAEDTHGLSLATRIAHAWDTIGLD